MNYTKEDYIRLWTKTINSYTETARADYNIDETYIYHDNLKYEIDKIVQLMNLYQEAKNYIDNLKKGDKIIEGRFHQRTEAEILKINYTKKKRNGKIRISSLTVKTTYDYKIKKGDVFYKGILYEDIFDVCLHFFHYMFFNEYDLEKADRILEAVKNGDLK